MTQGEDLAGQVAAAWRRNHGINLRIIRAIGPEGLRCTLSTRGGRNVARQFAHLHNVRGYQLRKRGKAFAGGLRVLESKEAPDARPPERRARSRCATAW